MCFLITHCRQTPVEVLHTILLGPVKYLVRKTMKNLRAFEKKHVNARIEAFDFSAFSRRLPSSFVKNYASFVGRDFKLWAQIAVYSFSMDQSQMMNWKFGIISVRQV